MIYVLPKMHKNATNPPGRPIVSGCGSILEPIGKYIDAIIKEFVPLTDTYVRDSMDLINLIEDTLFTTTDLLVGLDIESLYTNILYHEGLTVIRNLLESRPQPTRVPTHFVMDLLEIALSNNYFLYKDKFYLQIKGVSMGACFAPNFAILYVRNLEKTKILTPHNPFQEHITFWRHYIDNILLIWKGTKETLQLFLDWLNSCQPHLKFTADPKENNLPFLDLTLQGEDEKIGPSLFRKPTERNTLLLYKRFHPRGLRDGLPFKQFLWIRGNCKWRKDDFREAAILTDKLLQRGYPKKLVTRACKRAWYNHRETLLIPKEKHRNTHIPFVSTFCPSSNKVC